MQSWIIKHCGRCPLLYAGFYPRVCVVKLPSNWYVHHCRITMRSNSGWQPSGKNWPSSQMLKPCRSASLR